KLKFNIHKDAKTLMEAIEKRRNKIDLEDQSLNDLFNSLKIYEAEVKSYSSTSPNTQNIAFVSSQNTDSTNESVSAVASVFAASAKVPISALSNVDTLSNAEMDLRKSQFDVISYKTRLESVEARILVYQQNETVFDEDIKLLKLDVQLRDNALVELRKKFERAKQKRDELKLKLDKFQTSSKNLSQLLASQTNDKTRLGYDNQVFNSSVFACDEMFSSESDVSMPASPIYDRYQSGEGYHAVPHPYTGTFMPSKPDLVFHDALTMNESVPTVFNVELSPTKPIKDLPTAPIIEDCISDLEDEYEGEPMTAQKAPSFVQTTEHVKA
nr:hypothetical protein [Tanacetum cinerariifolium]